MEMNSMRFIKENKEMLILLVLLIAGENLHLFFVGEIRANTYFFMQQLGVINLIPSIIIYSLVKKKASKAIGLGIIVWNTKEILDEIVHWLYGYNSIFDPIEGYGVEHLKILFIISVVTFSYLFFYHKNTWAILSRLYYQLLPLSWQIFILKAKKEILKVLKTLLIYALKIQKKE